MNDCKPRTTHQYKKPNKILPDHQWKWNPKIILSIPSHNDIPLIISTFIPVYVDQSSPHLRVNITHILVQTHAIYNTLSSELDLRAETFESGLTSFFL